MAANLLAGAASRCIMPTRAMAWTRVNPAMTPRLDETGSPVQTKVLTLSSADQTLVLVALDLCYAAGQQADPIRQAVAREIGVDLADVTLTCSHSHSTSDLEPTTGPQPYLDFVVQQSAAAARQAWDQRRPGRIGHSKTHVAGASFNQRVPLANGGVKFTRDYREGLAAGGTIDPRLSVIRIDDEHGQPIAGWVRFAAHPACVIFDAPISAEYPGYMTDQLSQTVAGGAPVLFAFGAAGDVNCVPMFGSEDDARNLGLNLAALAGPVFESIETRPPQRLCGGNMTVDLPLAPPPSLETLEHEIAEVAQFIEHIEREPDLEWVLDVNCVKTWTADQKRAFARPLGQWAQDTRAAIESGQTFPTTWPSRIGAWLIDDLALVFYGGEPFTATSLDIAARSPLADTLVIAHGNGMEGYLPTDEAKRRGGYEPNTSFRYTRPAQPQRSLPYAFGAADIMAKACLDLIDQLGSESTSNERNQA